MATMLDVIDAVKGCKKHECSTIAISTCEQCEPYFQGHYESVAGRATICCTFPDDPPSMIAEKLPAIAEEKR